LLPRARQEWQKIAAVIELLWWFVQPAE